MATTGWSVEDRENFYQSGWLLSQNCKVIILILLLFFPLSRTTVSIDINITESWCANTTTVHHINTLQYQTGKIIFLDQKTIYIKFQRKNILVRLTLSSVILYQNYFNACLSHKIKQRTEMHSNKNFDRVMCWKSKIFWQKVINIS